MRNEAFVSYEDFGKILHGFNCPCCMGVRLMPDEQELEQRINDMMDRNREEVRKAILSLEIKQMNDALNQTKAVMK